MKHKLGLQLQVLYFTCLHLNSLGFTIFCLEVEVAYVVQATWAQQVFNHPLSCQNIGVLLNIFVSEINYNP